MPSSRDYQPKLWLILLSLLIAIFLFALEYEKRLIRIYLISIPTCNASRYRQIRFEKLDSSHVGFSKLTLTYSEKSVNSDHTLVYRNFTCRENIFYWASSALREYTRFIHLKNLYASSSTGQLATPDKYVFFWEMPFSGWYRPVENIPTYDFVIENAVYIVSEWSHVFGHFLVDCLSSLVQIPQEILDKSQIILSYRSAKDVDEWMDILSINKSNVVYHFNRWVFCKNVYTIVHAERLLGCYVKGIPMLRERINKSLELYKIEPRDYMVSNRPGTRSIHNMDVLVEALKLKYPDRPWIVKPFRRDTIKETICEYTKSKLLLCPGGSGCYNVMFMQKNSGLCALMGTTIEAGCLAIAGFFDIWAIAVPHIWGHFQGSGGNVDINQTLYHISRLIYAIDNGKWPEYPNTMKPFNLKQIKDAISPYPYKKSFFYPYDSVKMKPNTAFTYAKDY